MSQTAAKRLTRSFLLLYELLTGRPPFNGEELLRSGLDEMRRVIREEPPRRPSTRLNTMHPAEVTALSARRHASVTDLSSALRGDLDSIAMKCLEKDRARRYETASALAADIQRHLDREPIQARPVSTLGRLWRWGQRRPAIAALRASVLLPLIVVAVGSTVAAWRVASTQRGERSERDNAEAANRKLRGANTRLTDTVNVLELGRAEDLLRANDSSAGVAHLAAILRNDPSNHIAACRLVSALVHRNWALPGAPSIRHANRLPTVSFSPNGSHVLSASWDKTAQIRDANTGRLVITIQHDDAVLFAAYGRAGHRFVTTSADGTARIWNATNGAPLTPPMRPSMTTGSLTLKVSETGTVALFVATVWAISERTAFRKFLLSGFRS